MSDVVVFGSTSMVGSHFVETSTHHVSAAGRVDPRSKGVSVERFHSVDLEAIESLRGFVAALPEQVVVNFAARTDVESIEKERPPLGSPPSGAAWTMNSLAPQAMAAGCQDSGKRFVQVSTDFVFDGVAGPYAEEAALSPLSPRLNWYGWTKQCGERSAREQNPRSLVVRIAFPYRTDFAAKTDFARRLVELARLDRLPSLFSDQRISPTWVPDVSRALDRLIEERAIGVVHVCSPEPTTPFEFGSELLARVPAMRSKPVPGSIRGFNQQAGRAPRPEQGGLSCGRADELGIRLTNWRDGIELLSKESGWSR